MTKAYSILNEENQFDFLEKLALDSGAIETKIIPAENVVVEDRVVLKCIVGCPSYKKKLNCPPYAPTVDEFRKMLKDYQYAMLVKFKSNAKIENEKIARSLLRCQYDEEISTPMKEEATKFLNDWKKDNRKFNKTVLELEKAAFNKGFTFAVGFSIGSCSLCEKCRVEDRVCIYPTMTRFPEHAVGVNMKKTVEKAGMTISFPFEKVPDPVALLLID
jgi:predicted metal-binding protein